MINFKEALDQMGWAMIAQGVARGNAFTVNMGQEAFDALLREVDDRWNPFLPRDPMAPSIWKDRPTTVDLHLPSGTFKVYMRGYGRSVEVTPS